MQGRGEDGQYYFGTKGTVNGSAGMASQGRIKKIIKGPIVLMWGENDNNKFIKRAGH